MFKLRRKSDGLFSCGGSYVAWNKVGKMWRRLCDISSHLTTHYRNSKYGEYGFNKSTDWSDLEIVEYELKEKTTAAISVEHLRDNIRRREKDKQTKIAKAKRNRLLAEYKQAKAVVDKFEQG